MPSFCRHNRLVQNCPICSREQAVEMRPVVTSGTPKVSQPRPAGGAGRGSAGSRPSAPSRAPGAGGGRPDGRGGAGGLRVRRVARGAEDGYHSRLVPGLKSSGEAGRLADELAYAATRLEILAVDPPGLYAEVAAAGDLEERIWLAFLIAYLSPLEDEEPFGAIESARTTWASGELPDLTEVPVGPRSARDPARVGQTLEAYRAWAGRAGSQERAFTGEPSWTPERRFDRVFERMALPGMPRDTRYELLVSLGRLGVLELRGASLHIGGENPVTLGAKRALGIGDPLLLQRRAAELSAACGVPLEALDLGLHNWERGERSHGGLAPDTAADPGHVEQAHAALGL